MKSECGWSQPASSGAAPYCLPLTCRCTLSGLRACRRSSGKLSLTCSAVLRSLKVLPPSWDTTPGMPAATHRPSGWASALRWPSWALRWCNGLVTPRRQRRWDLWIVDSWSSFLLRFPGVSQVRVPPSSGACRACGLPPGACMSQPGRILRGSVRCLWRTGLWGNQWGHYGWLRGPCPVRRAGFRGRVSYTPLPFHLLLSPQLAGRGLGAPPGLRSRARGVSPEGRIWLILPVVICLSQRLSHACLSISTLYCETANGSLNQLSFI